MSIDINWASLTTGPDGAAFAETVRAFIHERFQHVTLPRFIRSVHVHSFDFGSVPPDLEVKDVCDPLPDFYDEDDDDDDEDDDDDDEDEGDESANAKAAAERHQHVEPSNPTASMRPPDGPASIDSKSGAHARVANPPRLDTTQLPSYYPQGFSPVRPNSPESFGRRSSTPGIPGGTSNLSSFHLPLSAGISGASTPLAAFGGPRFGGAAQGDHHAFLAKQNGDRFNPAPHHASSASARPTRPPLQQPSTLHNATTTTTTATATATAPASNPSTPDETTPAPNDVQVVLRATYTGDVRLVLTADILLDYPMTSFVGIPLKLTVTGLQFDGVAILAHMRHKACFCFLSPDDADALVGLDGAREPHEGDGRASPAERRGSATVTPGQDDDDEVEDGRARASQAGSPSARGAAGEEKRKRIGNLLEEIRIESEIGEKKEGKQVLKNVGKVEKFVLEQVRRIFEQEFVYPSFWTFLV